MAGLLARFKAVGSDKDKEKEKEKEKSEAKVTVTRGKSL